MTSKKVLKKLEALQKQQDSAFVLSGRLNSFITNMCEALTRYGIWFQKEPAETEEVFDECVEPANDLTTPLPSLERITYYFHPTLLNSAEGIVRAYFTPSGSDVGEPRCCEDTVIQKQVVTSRRVTEKEFGNLDFSDDWIAITVSSRGRPTLAELVAMGSSPHYELPKTHALAHPGPAFSFSEALVLLKNGGRVARTGWNGKGMWIALQTPDEHSKMTLPYIYMFTADGSLVPWLASQTDIMANDWITVSKV